jgi:cytochrome c2
MRLTLLAMAWALAALAHAAGDPVAEARARWEASPHGELLRRILPPHVTPAQLPEPRSAGAQLKVKYCVQCHHLANPAMHEAGRWPAIVERMLPRMQGRGNRGELMHALMADVQAPSAAEARVLTAYLQKHAQKRAEADALPEAGQSRAWASFTQACNQCHALPDPRRHTRGQWPLVVARMERNMEWMNRVVGSKRDPREPRYDSAEIVAYLQRHARP